MYGRALQQPRHWGPVRRALGVALAAALALGAATAPEVWAAIYFVDVATGSDANSAAAAQSALTPWKTLTRALDGTAVDGLPNPELAAGDVVNVAAGTHDAAAGETFPLFLVSGVAVVGAGAGATVIRAPDGSPAFFNEDTPLLPATRLSAVTLANAGAVAAADEGLRFEQSASNTMAPEIDDVTFDASLSDGIQVVDDGLGDGVFTGLIRNNTFNVDDDGVDFSQLSSGGGGGQDFSPTIRNNTFANGSDGVLVGIVSSSSSGGEGTFSPIIRNNTFTSADDGVSFVGLFLTLGDITVAPLISTNTFTGVGEDAVDFEFSGISLGLDTLSVSPTIVDNTVTAPGDQGVEIDVAGLCCGHLVSDLLVTGNTVAAPPTVGVDLSLTSLASDIDLDWTVANNTVSAAGAVGIFAGFSSNSSLPSGAMDITIAGNTVTDPGGVGIWFALFSQTSMSGSLDLLVAGNTVTGAGFNGLRLDISTMSSLSAMDVVVRDNFADGNLVGVAVNVASPAGEPEINPTLVTCNTATDNTAVGILQSSLPDTFNAAADYGGGQQSSPGRNTLTGNGDFDFVNLAVPAVKAESNWWGTAVAASIDANISDDEDVPPTGGEVDFDPPLLAPPALTLAVPLVDAVVADVAPPGASLGDTIQYTATVTGTGECGCASLGFTAAIPANATLVPGSVTTSKGTILDEDPVTVSFGHLAAAETVTVTWQVTADSGTLLSSQGTIACAQLAGGTPSDDPDAAGPADPTVTTLAAISLLEIPTLGEWALVLLAGLLLLSGLVLLRRRRAGPVALAGLVGLLLVPGNAATAPVATARTALVAQATVGGDLVTLRLADGTQVAVDPAKVEVEIGRPGRGAKDPAARSLRAAARTARRAAAAAGAMERGEERERDDEESLGVGALRSGQAMVARVLYDRAGAVRKVKVRLYENPAAAQSSLTDAAQRATTRAQARAERAAKGKTR